MTKNILKLSAAVIIGLYAQAAHATNTGWTAEEYEALRRGESASWKYIGKEAVDAGGDLDDLVTQLGTGGVDVLKAKLGVGGATSAEDDLDAQIDRVDATVNQTLAGAITAVKNAIDTGVPGDSLFEDVNNEADRLFGGPAASLKAAIDATLAGNPFPGAGLALIPTADNTTALADLTTQRNRIDSTGPVSIDAALDNVDALVPVNADLVQDLTAIQGTIGAGGDIPAAIAAQSARIGAGASIQAALTTQIARTATAAVAAPASISAGIDALQAVIGGANPVTGANADAAKALVGGAAPTITADVTAQRARIGAGASIQAALTTQIARIDSTPAASISAALDDVDALVPPNADLVQDLTAIRGTIDGAAAADIPAAIAAQATALTNTGGATIADGIAEVRAFVPTVNASIAEDLEAQRVLLDAFLASGANANAGNYTGGAIDRTNFETIFAYLLTRTVN